MQHAQHEWVKEEAARLRCEHETAMKKLKLERAQWEKQRKLADILPTKNYNLIDSGKGWKLNC
jgi:hypothetical protein